MLLLPQFQTIRRLGFSRHITFIVYLDTIYISKCILKSMYLEKPKLLIIGIEGIIHILTMFFWSKYVHCVGVAILWTRGITYTFDYFIWYILMKEGYISCRKLHSGVEQNRYILIFLYLPLLSISPLEWNMKQYFSYCIYGHVIFFIHLLKFTPTPSKWYSLHLKIIVVLVSR